ncbi:MAG: prepilin-type N-terminal cleavage/methylation domain-containing protein, partial [Verrucomicrobiota bacterium]
MKIQIHPLQKQAVRTRGLTLIELVVVLAVLVALVGMVLAFFPDIVRKASASTSANTAKDIGRTLQIKFTTQQTYGDGYDNFAISSSALSPALVGYGPTSYGIFITKPSPSDVTAFNAVGIASVWNVTGGTNTFNLTKSVVTLANTVDVVTLATNAPVILSYVPNAGAYANRVYYMFGLGQNCSAVGPDGFQ